MAFNNMPEKPAARASRAAGPVYIKVRDLTYIYRQGGPAESAALSGVALDIKKGEFVALVGPNGSGKSTLARHFNALLQPVEGTVLVDGMDTRRPECLWEIRQRVGMVFQNPDHQIVGSLVEEDVAFGAENLGLPPSEVRARVNEALHLTGLYAYRNHAPHLLSGGQKQRLAIAGVLAMRPDCLVLDEPSAMLDPSGRRELMEILIRLNRSGGVTVILVTHDMEEAAAADKIMIMSGGRLVRTGTPAEVFADGRLLQDAGLELPVAAEIAHGLRRRGIFVPDGILTVKDMVSYLCR